MKFNKWTLGLIAIGIVTASSVQAQVETNAPTTGTFVDSVIAYGTTSNTNFSFDTVKLDIETGYKQATGTGSASFTKFGYYVTPAIELDASIGYFGIGSPINSFEAGVGYALYQHYDVRITASLEGGYDGNARAGVVEPGFEAKKKLTNNTYASIGLYLPYFVGKTFNTNPTFETGVGATF